MKKLPDPEVISILKAREELKAKRTLVNERIRLLAKQYLCTDKYGPYHECTEGEHYEIELDEMKDFVQSIVKECISAVEDTNDRHRRDYFAAKIKQHFGIEE